jgi:hypothetical protein
MSTTLMSTNFGNLKENIENCIKFLENRYNDKQEEKKNHQNVSFPNLQSQVAPQQQHNEITQISEYLSHLEEGKKKTKKKKNI